MQDRNLFHLWNFVGDRMSPGFNQEAFYAALDTERLSRRKTWKQVAEESTVPASSLSRMKKGKKPDVDSLAKLISWSNLKTEYFIDQSGEENASSIARITALLRADPKLDQTAKDTLEKVILSTYNVLLPKG
ncbi:helix-turn-helix domain-containing protein [Aurantiacibacter sp. D1-12]|uniref:helix-turn-helix domain-containing protein n=1 Tax=Aurantiacibacter sp. D1-12 TaxID=2993658 RepID=UPI00237CB188|nr:helix-turn-helix domain-containing protein [Aurantiacibacter sp. D1-12]MDE1468327.1 helix-turn-helix domain-containing protein [Aurantiacibacter sp. D1-12]